LYLSKLRETLYVLSMSMREVYPAGSGLGGGATSPLKWNPERIEQHSRIAAGMA
jgi:hypothetical protein